MPKCSQFLEATVWNSPLHEAIFLLISTYISIWSLRKASRRSEKQSLGSVLSAHPRKSFIDLFLCIKWHILDLHACVNLNWKDFQGSIRVSSSCLVYLTLSPREFCKITCTKKVTRFTDRFLKPVSPQAKDELYSIVILHSTVLYLCQFVSFPAICHSWTRLTRVESTNLCPQLNLNINLWLLWSMCWRCRWRWLDFPWKG